MRKTSLISTAVAAAVIVIAGSLAPMPSAAQTPPAEAQPPAEVQPPAPPKPYKVVAVKLPEAVKDPAFEPFRKQLAAAVAKKDRAALGRLIARSFFWVPEDKDVADKKKSGLENLAKAIGLDGRDAPGWDLLMGYANDPTADKDPDRAGVICAPGDPTFDEMEAEQVAADTDTDAGDWGFTARNNIEVRSGPEKSAPVIDKLALQLVRVYPDDSPAGAVNTEALRIVTSSGKVGYVPSDSVLPLASDHICYIKEGGAWKIAGVLGGTN
jgi:hypothetical protein